MRRMLKYQMSFMQDTLHDVPIAEPKLCAVQNGTPALWFERDDGHVGRNVTFRVLATGEPIPDGWEHYGSAIDGPYVWHIYGK